MALPVNFIVYGRVRRENSILIVGATVSIVSATTPQGTLNLTTDASGKYYGSIKSYANDGDSMEVSCSFQHEDKTETFILDIGDGTKEINLNLTVTQVISQGYKGEGPAVIIRCGQCGYNNYYPKPSESYCCHACQAIMDEEGKTGDCYLCCNSE